MSDFENDMEELAADIALKAGGDIPLNDKIDAFKALMPYYALLKKSNKGGEEEDEDLPNFGNFQKKIHSIT